MSPKPYMAPKTGMCVLSFPILAPDPSPNKLLTRAKKYWSKLEGNDTMTWADPKLTGVGIGQARVAREAWKKGLAERLPAPQSYYASPMRRCLQTAKETFEGLELPAERPFKVIVKEVCLRCGR